jgi:hypothetical protein
MNYQEELKRLEIQEANLVSDYWKPEAGQYKVLALSEITDADAYEEEGKEPQARKQVHIRVDSKDVHWNFPLGKTKASTYGQLCSIAARNNNSLQAVTFTVVVVGSGQNRRFTIVG